MLVVDRLGRPFGSVTLGTEWDEAVRARIHALAAAELERSDQVQAYMGWAADPIALLGPQATAAEPELEEEERLRNEPVSAGG